MRSGLDDPQRIEVARRLLAEAGGEALDRLAALSARLLGAAYAQVALITDTIAPVTPIAPAQPRAEELIHQIVDLGMPIVLSNARVDGIGAFLGVPVDAAGARVGVLCVYDREPAAGPTTTSRSSRSWPGPSPSSSSAARWPPSCRRAPCAWTSGSPPPTSAASTGTWSPTPCTGTTG